MDKCLPLVRLAEFAATLSPDGMPATAGDTPKACLLCGLTVGIKDDLIAQLIGAVENLSKFD